MPITTEDLKELSKQSLRYRLRTVAQQTLKPPPKLHLDEWAVENFVLSAEASAEPGKFNWERAPYQRDMLRACSDPNYEEVVFCTSAQIGKTTILLALLLYYIQQEPAPILLVQPTKELAGSFSKDRLAPALRDAKSMAGLVAEAKSRDSNNTILSKSFPGGVINIVGSNAPSSLASRPVRVVLADEVDRYPPSAGTEGDPLQLAIKRSANFFNRKIIAVSTPTDELVSRIWARYLASDQRKYYVQCIHCDDHFVPRWEHIKWQKSPDGTHLPETVLMYCPHCGSGHTDTQRQLSVKRGEWRIHNPASKVAGFHLSSLISPWAEMEKLVVEFLTAQKDVQKLKTFMNTQLGEVWQDRSDNIDELDLIARVEQYEPASLPKPITLITAGIDTQDDRLECSTYGWAAENEVWHIEHQVFHGNPANPALWAELEMYLKTRFQREDGYQLPIAAACIDSGGHYTQEVYAWTKRHKTQRWFAIKGRAGPLPVWPSRASYTKEEGRLYIVGVDSAKETIYGWLRNTDPGPSYVHFSDRCTPDFFDQLSSARKVLTYRNGYTYYTWKKDPNRRAETLDCFEYALAAREALNVNIKTLRAKQEARVEKAKAEAKVEEKGVEKPTEVNPVTIPVSATQIVQKQSPVVQQQPVVKPIPIPQKTIPKWKQNLNRLKNGG